VTQIHWTFVGVAWFLLFSAAEAQEIDAPDLLFQSDEILDVRIVAPVSTLLSERPIDEELPGVFQYTNSAGEAVEFDIKLRTRGKFRRDKDNCRFPPLRLNFVKSQTKGTLFRKQNKVKLVTHCQNSSKYGEVLLREYVAYRLLNVMTDISFRVRLLRITYVENERQRDDDVRYGFIIEHRGRLAKRIGKSVLEISSTRARSLNPEFANMISLYHYLIGNTDFSSVKGPKDEICCHNHVLFGNEGEAVWSVPYDFDQAGLVDAPHAAPSQNFNIKTVKQRLYRGRCIHNDYVNATIANYQSKREELLQIIDELKVAESRTRKSMTSYVEKFFKTFESERRVNSFLIKKCI
jgi:hypothetical protein